MDSFFQTDIAKNITKEQGKTLVDAEGDVMRGLRKYTITALHRVYFRYFLQSMNRNFKSITSIHMFHIHMLVLCFDQYYLYKIHWRGFLSYSKQLSSVQDLMWNLTSLQVYRLMTNVEHSCSIPLLYTVLLMNNRGGGALLQYYLPSAWRDPARNC